MKFQTKKKGKTMHKHTDLIALAEKLNEARIIANAIPLMASQGGVYGQTVIALKQVLWNICEKDSALSFQMYQILLDGENVEYAWNYIFNS